MSDYFLADDLSGALDAAAAFHAAGARVTIALSPAAWSARLQPGEVIGLTTETRNASPELAAQAVVRAIAQGDANGARLVYKKIDSTLRGPVAAEIAALTRALPDTNVLFCPANPRVGRTVRDGILRVHGVRVDQTEFGRDPVSPVRESSIPKLLGLAALARVTIADAETEDELDAAVARIAALGDTWLAVGSGALARPVAFRRAPAGRRWNATARARASGPILFVCGSAHRGNVAQAAALTREFDVPVHELRLAEPAAAVRDVRASVRARGAAALVVEAARGDSAQALRTIATAAHDVVAATGVARLFVTGGETAFALCGTLGVNALAFLDELEPGLSLSQARTAAGDTFHFAIKPGGFGDERTWLRAWSGLAEA